MNESTGSAPARLPGILLYGMYPLPPQQRRAPEVRIALMTDALARRVRTERIVGGRFGRAANSLRWMIGGGPRRVRAVYVEAPTSSPMPTDLAFLALMRFLRKPVGVYFRDAYQLFRDVHPRTRRRQIVTDWLWRRSMPILRRVASVRYAPSAGLAAALRLADPVMLPPGTDPSLPDLGLGQADVVVAIVQIGPRTGLDTLIEAMRLVRQRRPAAKLRIGARAADQAASAGLPEWVEVVPASRGAMAEVVRPGRVCVLPLPVNAYTNLAVAVRLLDFLGFGKPVVTTDTAESRAIITASQAGVVTPDTPEGLAAGILEILGDERRAARLASRARAYASSPAATWDARARIVLETLGLAAGADQAELRKGSR